MGRKKNPQPEHLSEIAKINDVPELIKNYIDSCYTVKGYSTDTVLGYYRDLKILFRYVKLRRRMVTGPEKFNEIDLSDITPEFIRSIRKEDLKQYLDFSVVAGKRVSASSQRRRISAVRSFYKYLKCKNLIQDSKSVDLKPHSSLKTKPHYLTDDEINKLLAQCKGSFFELRDICIITLFYTCGLRTGELVGLNVADIYSDHLIAKNKKGATRSVHFDESCHEIIQNYLDIRSSYIQTDALFISRNMKRISPRGVEKMIKKRMQLAGINEKLHSPSQLRHTAVNRMLKNGESVEDLKEKLGYSNGRSYDELYSGLMERPVSFAEIF